MLLKSLLVFQKEEVLVENLAKKRRIQKITRSDFYGDDVLTV
jgi:hypothetical protein